MNDGDVTCLQSLKFGLAPLILGRQVAREIGRIMQNVIVWSQRSEAFAGVGSSNEEGGYFRAN